MRSLIALLVTLFAIALPSPALAGTFTVAFGYGTPMTGAGWVTNAQAGPVCGFEGVGTLWLNAGTLPAHSGCFYLFNAPAYAQIVAINVSQGFAKASAASGLCTYSFAAAPGDTLHHCAGGSFADAIATSGANWAELGIYNEGDAGIAIATPRANNIVYAGGWVTLSDPTKPELWANGPTGVHSGDAALLQWSASDSESGSPAVSYAIDGGARVAIRGQACSWICSTLVNGSVLLDLTVLADGPHAVTVYAKSYADEETGYGPFAFRVDRTAPAQPLVRVVPDTAAATAGWWGHAPVAVSVSTATAPDVDSSALRVYGPTGALVHQEAFAGAVTSAAIPASALTADGTYELDVSECDGAGHCATSSRAALRWDGSPPPAPADATAPPLGVLAARDGAHMSWPELSAAGGRSGIAGAFTGVGPTPAAARAQALAAPEWQPGVPGVSETSIPAASVHASERVCLAVRPVSGAGIAASSSGVRCALVDEQAPQVSVIGALRWSGGAQTVGLSASDANGAAFTQVLLDGVPVAMAGNGITVAGEGPHALRAAARDGAGNETVVERALGVDASPPVIGEVTTDFVARELRIGVRDPLAGVALAEVRVGGIPLETTISADRAIAIAHVPAGMVLDGAPVVVRVEDASSPANGSERSVTLPARAQPLLRGLSVARGRVRGRVVAATAARVRIWAYPKGRLPHVVGTYPVAAGGTFSVRVRPGRTTRYAVAVTESQELRSLTERVAGTVPVSARIDAPTLRVRGDRLIVRARFAGRGEATRLHLLVHDVRGGRWVEACLEHGRPGVRLERSGRVRGTCAIPPSARGRAWTYRLVLAAPSSTWPWRTPSSGSVSVLLPL